MIGLGKKVISAIFATVLLVGNALAAEPKLSGNYHFLQIIFPLSEAVTIAKVSQLKITPNKTGRSGKIEVIEGKSAGEGAYFTKGDVLAYRTTTKKLFISGFPCSNIEALDPKSGLVNSVTDCGKERSFDITYVDPSNDKITHHAFVSGSLETRKAFNGLVGNVLLLGTFFQDNNF